MTAEETHIHHQDDIDTTSPTLEELSPAEGALTSFTDLHLRPEVLDALKDMGFDHPMEVQVRAIPLALQGKDLLVQSRTGSGKTAAYAIPFAHRLVQSQKPVVQALVLAPTRELAIQIAEECTRVTAKVPLKITPIYGGAAMGPQVTALREGTHVVVGTPGRVLDHIRRGNFKTEGVAVLVLDECDEMLSMGFHEEITAIVEQLPEQRQTMLFSATIPEEIQRMADRYLKDPASLYLSEDFVGVREIQHIYYLVSGSDRTGDLLRVLDYEQPGFALIFCNTRDDTSLVADFLRSQGFMAEGISSDLTQADRERVMHRMRDGQLRFLVATDIAARGIDISDLTHVINYTFPEAADIYIHRTGRTGRAGKSGIAVSLVSPREIGSFYYLKLIHKIFPEERRLPSSEEIATRREGERFERLNHLYSGKEVSEEMRTLARRVWSTIDGERLVGLALAGVLSEEKEVFSERSPAVATTVEPEASSSSGDNTEAPRGRGRGKPERGRERSGGRAAGRGAGAASDRAPRGGSSRSGSDRSSAGERKTTRTRKLSVDSQEGAFTTPDGDVEQWEFVESSSPGASPGPATENSSVARLFLAMGKRHGIRTTEELVEFVEKEASIARDQISDLSIRDSYTHFSVPLALADTIIENLSGKTFKNKTVRVERAKR